MSTRQPLPVEANPIRDAYEPEILNSFRRILQALRLAAVQTQSETGISAAQLYVLSQLKTSGPLSINELAEATMTDRSSVADVVDRLARRKLVRRTSSREDRRRAEVSLTANGKALLAQAPPPPTALLRQGLSRLSDTEVHALAAGMTRLCEELGLRDEEPVMLFELPSATGRRRSRRQSVMS